MSIAIISGSHRPQSQSRRVADYLAQRLPQLAPAHQPVVHDLAGNPLPLWEEAVWDKNSPAAQFWQTQYATSLREASGFILISPEWAGMVPPGLKNFLLHMSFREGAHKPALIVTVSASRGGTHPVNELRVSGYKNNKMVYLPEHLIIRNVADMLQGVQPAGKDDEYLRQRIDYALGLLVAYAAALAPVREASQTADAAFPFGM